LFILVLPFLDITHRIIYFGFGGEGKGWTTGSPGGGVQRKHEQAAFAWL